ncbi:hypothetical protein KCF93_004421, partial [Salmonella enterica subsp. enterica serovar Javiana]|nr:hypothetical protein [Salmonella enterica subsp. enterica serovar Javiana]
MSVKKDTVTVRIVSHYSIGYIMKHVKNVFLAMVLILPSSL